MNNTWQIYIEMKLREVGVIALASRTFEDLDKAVVEV